MTGPSAGRVVVGVGAGDADGSAGALCFAFRAAQHRGIGITAVHAWMPPGPNDSRPSERDLVAAQARLDHVADIVRPYGDAFPDVEVRLRLVAGSPTATLVAESAAAALVVVGTRRHGPPRLSLRESVGRSLARSARSPVAVVGTASVGPGGAQGCGSQVGRSSAR
jgi:nucleotide-binding universal stress UspA family protein